MRRVSMTTRDELLGAVAARYGCVARIGERAQRPQPQPGLGDADVFRASQLQHAVEDMDRHVHLTCPTLIRARAQPVPDHPFPPPDSCLGPGPVRIPGRFLPGHAAPLGNELKMAVALCRRSLGCSARHRSRAWRNDDGRRGMTLADTGVHAILVVRTIACERGYRARDLVEQGTDLGAIIPVVVGQRRGHDLAGVGVQTEM